MAQQVTLTSVFEMYEPLIFDGLAANTIGAYRRAWALRVAPSLGRVPIADVTPLAVMQAHAAWTGSTSTRQDALALVSKLCEVAILDGTLRTNPVRSMPKRRRAFSDELATRALSDAQAARMLELTAYHPHAQRILAAMLYTGCRLGEVSGITREGIEADIIRIRRSRSPHNGVMQTGGTKGRAVRSVPILPDFRPYLDAAVAESVSDEYVFTGVRGGSFDSSNLARALRWPVIREQIKRFPADERPLRFHDLRHTAAVNLFRLGLAAPDVQRILGHSSLQVTELYARSGDAAATRAVEAAESLRSPSASRMRGNVPELRASVLVAEAGLEPATSRL